MTTSPREIWLTRIGALVQQRLGLAPSRLVQTGLAGAIDDLAAGDFPGLVTALTQQPLSDSLWQHLIRALMIGETYFLRNRAHLDVLRRSIAPEWITQLKHERVIWSAGCATGEEIYSLAMILRECLNGNTHPNLRLIGTDINARALQAAERGVYREWALRHTEADFRQRYFDPVEDGMQIKPFIRQMVTLRQMNILDGPPMPQVDLIVCCNVLLYFTQPAVQQVEDLLFETLAPEGWLMLGATEVIRTGAGRWITRRFGDVALYQKPSHLSAYRPVREPQPDPSAEAQTAYQQAVTALRLKEYDEALHCLAEVFKAQPSHAAARVLRGCILANQGHLAQAEAEIEAALSANPMQADAHYLKGVLLLEHGRDAAAIDSLKAALYCQPGHPLAGMILSHLYLKAHKPERARRIRESVLHALESAQPNRPVSDVSDLTVESVRDFLSEQ
jgi:chemotaxis protein methyltransferase CheR